MIGSKILVEALSRGHVVTAISRHPENLPTGLKNHANLRPAQAEVTDTAALTKLFQGRDHSCLCAPQVFGPWTACWKRP